MVYQNILLESRPTILAKSKVCCQPLSGQTCNLAPCLYTDSAGFVSDRKWCGGSDSEEHHT